ncbi:MAG: 2-amino-4-hydroxy-6-hydroxymethyldihydropteridine diphosphokinase [Lachnospiraceae bacterium]|nr:2-amino-4-hydroxy-6-hydroxymethyldihydropteridine diphosphokinase [Lachnospiraceae bacterium]
MDHIRIEELEIYANHGVYSEEQILGQKFLVSIDLELDLSRAGSTDDLTKSVHYGKVAQAASAFMKENTFKLIETAASGLARLILTRWESVRLVTVTVKKPWAPVGLPLDTVSATITRGRHRAVIALGSNLGDRNAYIQSGIDGLNADGTRVIAVSNRYETDPLGPVEQGKYINACALIETVLSPHELLDRCHEIEACSKRERLVHWGPRTLDLDIISYDAEVVDEPDLVIPHPQMHVRDFVLRPMAEIAPDWVHPVLKRTTIQLLHALPSPDMGNDPDFADALIVEKLPTKGRKVLYQGLPGAYAQAAMFSYFGNDVEHDRVDEWEEACVRVSSGKADYAVLPIENSTAGAVYKVLELMLKYRVYVSAQIMLPVSHALLGVPGAKLSDIKTVYSHPQALMQCAAFLEENKDWHQVSLKNTAVSAKKVMDEGDITQAAIASEISGRIYGLEVLKTAINDNANNITRFVVITGRPYIRPDAGRISICVELNHEAGALYKLLSYIAVFGLNMVGIASMPIPGRTFEYRFFIDFEGNVGDESVRDALRIIKRASNKYWFLGNFDK